MFPWPKSPRGSMDVRLLYLLLFLFLGGYGNFFPVWLKDIGWSDAAIGWLEGIRYLCLLFFPLAWGRLTDRVGNAVVTLRIVALGGAIAFVPVLWLTDLGSLMVVMAAFFAFRVGMVPSTDAVALSHVAASGEFYGQLRVWGSVGFIAGGFLVAWVIDLTDRSMIPAVMLATLVATWLLTLRMGPEPRTDVDPKGALRAVVALLTNPRLRAFYAITFATRLAGQGLFAFLPLHLESLGVSDGVLPLYWSVGVVSEIVLIRYAPTLFGRWSPRTVLGLCLATAVVQYGLFASVTSAWMFLPVMLLHGLTFGIWYLTSILYLGAEVPEARRATAQALFQMTGFGLGGVISSVAAGYLYGAGAGPLLFRVATIVAVLAFAFHIWLFPRKASGC